MRGSLTARDNTSLRLQATVWFTYDQEQDLVTYFSNTLCRSRDYVTHTYNTGGSVRKIYSEAAVIAGAAITMKKSQRSWAERKNG